MGVSDSLIPLCPAMQKDVKLQNFEIYFHKSSCMAKSPTCFHYFLRERTNLTTFLAQYLIFPLWKYLLVSPFRLGCWHFWKKKYFIFQEINLHVTGLGKRNILQSERPILADYIGDCDNSLINIQAIRDGGWQFQVLFTCMILRTFYDVKVATLAGEGPTYNSRCRKPRSQVTNSLQVTPLEWKQPLNCITCEIRTFHCLHSKAF